MTEQDIEFSEPANLHPFPVRRTERGWMGHFILADRCTFRRNTLLEGEDTRVVVSTVGALLDFQSTGESRFKYGPVGGYNRFYETKAFVAKFDDGYWDADISKPVPFDSNGCINHTDLGADMEANDMHEAVVVELGMKM